MKAFLSISLLIFLFANTAWAQTANELRSGEELWRQYFSKARERWDQNFYGRSKISVSDLEDDAIDAGAADISPWIDFPSECQEHVHTMQRNVQQYHRLAFENKDASAETVYQKIQFHLFNAISESNVCFKPVAQVYVARSMIRLQLAPGSYNNQFAILFLLLSKSGYVEFITPDLRKRYQGIWSERRKNGKSKIWGAYQCEDSKIYIDLTLPPFDLASVWIHELDHLFRDKFDFDSGLSLRAQLVLDETLATVYSAHSQRRMDDPYRSVGPFYARQRPFLLSFDRSLFSKRGDVTALWKMARNKTFQPWNRTYEYFLFKTFLRSPTKTGTHIDVLGWEHIKDHPHSLGIWNEKIEAKIDQKVNSVYQKIYRNYFGQKFSEAQSLELLPKKLGWDWAPLSVWESEYNTAITDQFFKDLFELWTRLKKKSDSCVRFEQGLRSGELNGYIGSSSDPIKTGTEGGKPTDPMRPGTDGAKPGFSVKPCLRWESPP